MRVVLLVDDMELVHFYWVELRALGGLEGLVLLKQLVKRLFRRLLRLEVAFLDVDRPFAVVDQLANPRAFSNAQHYAVLALLPVEFNVHTDEVDSTLGLQQYTFVSLTLSL